MSPTMAPPRAIVESILQNDAPTWLQMYPGLSINMDGELQEEIEFQQAMVYPECFQCS